MNKKETVQFTEQQAKDFIIAYNKAIHDHVDSFTFENREYLRPYAYYIILWWDMEKFITGTFDHNKKYTQHEHHGS